jgi:hypothetical protein
MPPFVFPPLVKLALGAAGAAAVVHWVVREVRRINDELDRARAVQVVEAVRRDALPTLRRDPRTGDYRVM